MLTSHLNEIVGAVGARLGTAPHGDCDGVSTLLVGDVRVDLMATPDDERLALVALVGPRRGSDPQLLEDLLRASEPAIRGPGLPAFALDPSRRNVLLVQPLQPEDLEVGRLERLLRDLAGRTARERARLD